MEKDITGLQEVMDIPETRVQQQHKDACDINIMVKRARRGMAIRAGSGTPQYGDFSIFRYDYLSEATKQKQKAQMLFDELNPELREKFDNDPLKLLQYIENPNNKKDAQQLGIIKPDAPVVDKDAEIKKLAEALVNAQAELKKPENPA